MIYINKQITITFYRYTYHAHRHTCAIIWASCGYFFRRRFQGGYCITENKKCAKYDSSRPIIFGRTLLYADYGITSAYARLWNTTMKVRRGMRVLHLTSLVE